MDHFQVVAIQTNLAQTVRDELKSPQYGHPAHVSLATGYGPCRHCLQTFHEGREQRILFTYNPFEAGLTPLPGPVFIHEKNCRRFEGSGIPVDLNRLPLLFESYNRQGRVVAIEQPATGDAATAITRAFTAPEIDFLHIRNAEAGCFIARVERRFPLETGQTN